MNFEYEVPSIEEVQPLSVVEAQDRAFVDIQISTAKKYPRNVKRALNNSLAIITMSMDIAKSCHYALPRKNKDGQVTSISGPSVHLAKILAQNWGNMRIETKVIGTDDKHVTSQAVAFDLENNLAVKVEVKRSIVGKYGRYSDDMITVTGNASNAIALRNAVFSVIPRGVVDECYNQAKQMMLGDISDQSKLILRRKQVVDGLKDTYSVTEKEILTVIGRQSWEHITADDLTTLIGIGTAIKEGDTTVEQVFKRFDVPVDKILFDDVQYLFDLKKNTLTEDELKNANRILDNKEEKSYSKLFKTLKAK